MYQEQLPTLWLHKSRIIFRDEYGLPYPLITEIQDLCQKVNKEPESIIKPDYTLRGFYRNINKRMVNEFIVSPKGTDILLITGVPKGGELDAFKWHKPKYISYWEDSNKGFLFQIFEEKRYSDGYILSPVYNTNINSGFPQPSGTSLKLN